MSLSIPSHSQKVGATPSVFHYFESLPCELQLMVWEEFLHSADKTNPRVVLLNARRSDAIDLGPELDDLVGFDMTWCLTLDNREQLDADPRCEVAHSLMALCDSSRHVATRFLDANRHSGASLHFARDIFWLPDDLVRYAATVYDSAFRPDGYNYGVPFYLRDDIEPTEVPATHNLLEDIKYVMISLDTFEQILLWAGPSYEQCGDIDNETFWRQKDCMRNLLDEFGAFQNLLIMVDIPRGHIFWNDVQVVDVDDPALQDVDARGGPDRYVSVSRKYQALIESRKRALIESHKRTLRMYLDSNNSDGDSHAAHVLSLEMPWWMSQLEAPKLSFALSRS